MSVNHAISSVRLFINTENMAFQEDLEEELTRILTDVRNKIRTDGLRNLLLRDYNGNPVGELTVSNKQCNNWTIYKE